MDRLKTSPSFDASVDLVIFEGDCLDLLATIPDGLTKLVVTSPPYNLLLRARMV